MDENQLDRLILIRDKISKYVIKGVESRRDMELNVDALLDNELKIPVGEVPIDVDKVLRLLNRSLADTRKLLGTLIKDLGAE